MTPSVDTLSAWSDESFQERDSAGFYIIAAAVIEPAVIDKAREAMLQRRGRMADDQVPLDGDGRPRASTCGRRSRDSWRPTRRGCRFAGTRTPTGARAEGVPVRACYPTSWLPGRASLYGGPRAPAQRQGHRHSAARSPLRAAQGDGLSYRSRPRGTEPLLWIADIVAGACRAEQLGRAAYREALGDVVLDFEVSTRC